MKTNVIGGVLFLVLGLAVLLLIPHQVPAPEPGMIGPRYVPTIMAIGMIALSVILIIQGLLSKDDKETPAGAPAKHVTVSPAGTAPEAVAKATSTETPVATSKRNVKPDRIALRAIFPTKEALLTTLLIVLWVVGLSVGIGFIPTSIVFVIAGLLLYRTRGWLNYAVAIAFVFGLYVVFAVFLRVQLP